jgi:hypothetical protein
VIRLEREPAMVFFNPRSSLLASVNKRLTSVCEVSGSKCRKLYSLDSVGTAISALSIGDSIYVHARDSSGDRVLKLSSDGFEQVYKCPGKCALVYERSTGTIMSTWFESTGGKLLLVAGEIERGDVKAYPISTATHVKVATVSGVLTAFSSEYVYLRDGKVMRAKHRLLFGKREKAMPVKSGAYCAVYSTTNDIKLVYADSDEVKIRMSVVDIDIFDKSLGRACSMNVLVYSHGRMTYISAPGVMTALKGKATVTHGDEASYISVCSGPVCSLYILRKYVPIVSYAP